MSDETLPNAVPNVPAAETAPGGPPLREELLAEAPDNPARATPPGLSAMVLAGLVIGILLLGIQLWLLTIALDLYLDGSGGGIWLLALFSGLVFVGGLLVLRWLGRR
jgi:hypothetical protein